MDFSLRCNSLKCRAQLTERAVVTTCSHVFCVNCSNNSSLSHGVGNDRTCPACQSRLINADDVVATTLNPSEDYKTSILSGLSPSIIMECAGRGLAFYSYQAGQEIVYQEHLAKGLAAKHNTLSVQIDQIIHDANAEIVKLRDRISTLETDQEALNRKNDSLREAYGEKVRQYQKCQANYDKIRKRVLDSNVQLAAENAVEETLHKAGETQMHGNVGRLTLDHNGIEQVHRRQRSGTSTHEDRSHRSGPSYQAPGFARAWQEQSQNNTTPATHRTRLPIPTAQRVWTTKPFEALRPHIQPNLMAREPNANPNSSHMRQTDRLQQQQTQDPAGLRRTIPARY